MGEPSAVETDSELKRAGVCTEGGLGGARAITVPATINAEVTSSLPASFSITAGSDFTIHNATGSLWRKALHFRNLAPGSAKTIKARVVYLNAVSPNSPSGDPAILMQQSRSGAPQVPKSGYRAEPSRRANTWYVGTSRVVHLPIQADGCLGPTRCARPFELFGRPWLLGESVGGDQARVRRSVSLL